MDRNSEWREVARDAERAALEDALSWTYRRLVWEDDWMAGIGKLQGRSGRNRQPRITRCLQPSGSAPVQ